MSFFVDSVDPRETRCVTEREFVEEELFLRSLAVDGCDPVCFRRR